MRCLAMLKEVNSLPRSQGHSPVLDRHRQLRESQGGADMSGHIVRPLDAMAIQRFVLRRETIEKDVQVMYDVGIRVSWTISDADVCCTNTVSKPRTMWLSFSHFATAPVISYSPLPRVATCRVCVEIGIRICSRQNQFCTIKRFRQDLAEILHSQYERVIRCGAASLKLGP